MAQPTTMESLQCYMLMNANRTANEQRRLWNDNGIDSDHLVTNIHQSVSFMCTLLIGFTASMKFRLNRRISVSTMLFSCERRYYWERTTRYWIKVARFVWYWERLPLASNNMTFESIRRTDIEPYFVLRSLSHIRPFRGRNGEAKVSTQCIEWRS